eukprot:1917422-Rhodomonas_salina.1
MIGLTNSQTNTVLAHSVHAAIATASDMCYARMEALKEQPTKPKLPLYTPPVRLGRGSLSIHSSS